MPYRAFNRLSTVPRIDRQAVVTVRVKDGRHRDIDLVKHNTEQSLEKYCRIVAQLIMKEPTVVSSSPKGFTIGELIVLFLRHAKDTDRTPESTP